jgi:hypothetical protein
VSSLFFWLVLTFLGLSVVFGLVFLMHGVTLVSEKKYDVYAFTFRGLAIAQIILVMIGIGVLCFELRTNKVTSDPNMKSVQIHLDGQKIVRCPIDAGSEYSIECDNGKIYFSSQSPIQNNKTAQDVRNNP